MYPSKPRGFAYCGVFFPKIKVRKNGGLSGLLNTMGFSSDDEFHTILHHESASKTSQHTASENTKHVILMSINVVGSKSIDELLHKKMLNQIFGLF